MNAVNEQEPVSPHNAVLLLVDQPYVVVDACGRVEPQPSVATVSRLSQAGVALVNTRVVVLEAMADNAHPKAKEIYATLPAGPQATRLPAGQARSDRDRGAHLRQGGYLVRRGRIRP